VVHRGGGHASSPGASINSHGGRDPIRKLLSMNSPINTVAFTTYSKPGGLKQRTLSLKGGAVEKRLRTTGVGVPRKNNWKVKKEYFMQKKGKNTLCGTHLNPPHKHMLCLVRLGLGGAVPQSDLQASPVHTLVEQGEFEARIPRRTIATGQRWRFFTGRFFGKYLSVT